MSRIKLFLDVVSDLRSLADSLQAVADAVAQGGQEQPTQKPEKKTAAKQVEPPVEKPETKPLTLEQVRAALAEKSRAGHTSEIKEAYLYTPHLDRSTSEYVSISIDNVLIFFISL